MGDVKPVFLRRPAGGADRRRVPRTVARARVSASVEVEGREGTVVGVIRDLSRGGVGLDLPVEVAVGARMEFRAMVGIRAIRAVCRVANCRADGKGGFIVGAEIVAADRVGDCADVKRDGVDEARVEEVRRRLAEVVEGRIGEVVATDCVPSHSV